MQIKHKFASPKADGVDSTVVRPSNWNADHDAISAAASIVLGRDTSGSGAVQELPIAVTPAGDASLPNARGFFLIAAGTTAQRPGSPVNGMVRYNTDTGLIEFYNGAWTSVANASTATVAYVDMAIANLPSVRQSTVGPVGAADGLPSLLPPTSVTLFITSQNVSGSAPFVASAANNNNSVTGKVVNLTGVSAVNLTWNGLTASRAAATPNFLYVTVNPDGTLTPGVTLVPPIYQFGGVPSVTNGQFTFNIGEMRGYMGNGSTALQAYIVFVGEAATDSSSVISTVVYAYNGMYEGPFVTPLPVNSVFTPGVHNLGVRPGIVDFVIECIVAEQGYAVGDRLNGSAVFTNAGGSITSVSVVSDRLTMGFQTGTNAGLGLLSRTAGGPIILTPADWRFKFFARRNWE